VDPATPLRCAQDDGSEVRWLNRCPRVTAPPCSACDGLTRPASALVRAWRRRHGPPV